MSGSFFDEWQDLPLVQMHGGMVNFNRSAKTWQSSNIDGDVRIWSATRGDASDINDTNREYERFQQYQRC